MKSIKNNLIKLIIGVAILSMGFLLGWLTKPASSIETSANNHEIPSAGSNEEVIWTCSMDPQVRQAEPGKCPICGMDLIPLGESETGGDPFSIKMSSAAIQLANVQTAIIGQGNTNREVRMNGKVQPDERLVYSQVTHIEGRVEDLSVNFTGEFIQKGQKLANIYSPELITAQEELFAAQKLKDMQPALFIAAKEKLKNWKLSNQQIEDILAGGKPQERFSIHADVGGIVRNKKVNLGDYLMRGMPLYEIVDLSKVWVLFDVYESDMAWVKVGSQVSFTIQSLPGESFAGRITFIDPVINPLTRVATARIEVSNPNGKFKPEMFATGIVKTQLASKKGSMVVPKTAVMWTGERSVVYIKNETEEGIAFQMKEVTLGPLVGDNYVIEKGLEQGSEIVVNGTFSIDAAAQLSGKPSMMNKSILQKEVKHNEQLPDYTVSTPTAFKQQLVKVSDAYFQLKDAFVATDREKASAAASLVLKKLSAVDMTLLKGNAHQFWMDQLNAMRTHSQKISEINDVEAQRKQFDLLSQSLIKSITVFGVPNDTFYVQHCPMANKNNGADWISKEKEIRNPYYGDKMLTCGVIQMTITKDFKNPPMQQISKAPQQGHNH